MPNEAKVHVSKHVSFPTIRPLLEQEISYLDLIRLYPKQLKRQKTIECNLAANKLVQAAETANNPENLRNLENIYVEMKSSLDKWIKEVHFPYPISIFKRRKNFIGTLEKIFQCIEKGTLSEVNDILGFRIMIDNGIADDAESIHWLYRLTEKVYEFFTKEKGFCPFSFKHVPDENWYKGNDVHIYIPECSEIPAILLEKNNIKDYVAFAKENGYQSIHIVFTGANGNSFEVQLRTQAMHIHAEYGDANHSKYKDTRYNRDSVEDSYEIPIEEYDVKIISYIQIDLGDRVIVNDPLGLNHSIDHFNLLLNTETRVVKNDDAFLDELYGPAPKAT